MTELMMEVPLTGHGIGDNPQIYRQLINTAAFNIVQDVLVKPAQEIAAVLKEHDTNRKLGRVPKLARQCLKNPDTTTGACCTKAMTAQMHDTVAGKKRKTEAAEARKENKEANERATASRGHEFLAEVRKTRYENRHLLTLPTLRGAFRTLTGRSGATLRR